MKKLWAIYIATITESVNRRGEMLVYILQDFIGPLLSILLWIGIVNYSGSIQAGWGIDKIVSYFMITTLLTLAVNHYTDTLVGYEHIAQGEIAGLLLKPVPYHLYVFSTESGWKTVRLLVSLIPLGFLLFIFKDLLIINFSAYQIAAALIFSILAYLIIFFFKFIIGMSAFWVTANDGIVHTSWAFQSIFGGRLIPFNFLPLFMQNLSLWLPFRFFFYMPANVLISNLTPGTLLRELGIGLLWLTILIIINILMFNNGLKRLTDTK